MLKTPSFPFAAPPWLTPRRILYPTILLFIASATLPTVWQIDLARSEMGSRTSSALIVTASTALLSLYLVRRALRAAGFDKTLLWCVFVAMPLGALNAALAEALIAAYKNGDAGQIFGGFLLALFIGGFIAAPIGLIYGILYAIPTSVAKRALEYPSHEGPDRLMITAGLWISILGALISVMPEAPHTWISPPWLIFIGVFAAAIGIYRWAGRKIWYARIENDEDPRYMLIDPDDDEPSAYPGLLPLFKAEPPNDARVKLLMYIPPAKDIAYRDKSRAVPVALLGQEPKPLFRLSPTSPPET